MMARYKVSNYEPREEDAPTPREEIEEFAASLRDNPFGDLGVSLSDPEREGFFARMHSRIQAIVADDSEPDGDEDDGDE